ncbi:MAG: TM2 domain-containing protein [Lachnospiraceae bacterium]|nr:TM2 domain-containing protein [Lachnospiraceae bacterium]
MYEKERLNDKTKGILIAIFLGELGGYRFYRHQYFLGIIYLFTCGLFMLGYLYDIYAALTYDCNKYSTKENSTVIDTIHTKVVGVSFECDHGTFDDRQEAIEALSYRRKKNALALQYFEYKGEPAFYVVMNSDNTDIGCLKANLSSELTRKYSDCTFVISDYEITGGEDRRKFGCNITIQVLRSKNQINY